MRLIGGADSGMRASLARFLIARSRFLPFFVFVLIALVTALGTIAIEGNERASDEIMMREASHSVAVELDRRLSIQTAFLRAGAALFKVEDKVDRQTFSTFVSELPQGDDSGGPQGIGWAEVINQDQVPAFEKRLSEELGAGIDVKGQQKPDPAMIIPVTYLEPITDGNTNSIGFDLYSDPNRRDALNLAAQTGQPAASGKLTKANRPASEGPGFLILMPVYDRQRAGQPIKGFVFSPFKAKDFLNSAMAVSVHKDLNVQLYDGAAKPENLLASHIGTGDPDESFSEVIEVANHTLTVEVSTSRGLSLSLLALETLIFGLAAAVLLAVLVRILTQQAIADQEAVNRLKEQVSIRETLTRELNHRVKNTLANVLSIISLTRRRSTNIDSFASSLDGRVRALSATHDLLTGTDWKATPLRDVITTEMGPLGGVDDGRLEVSGPDILLAPNDALSIGLAMHELATNAAKYGALSVEGGKVIVTWQLQADNLAIVEWREEGGPPVQSGRKRGFGTELIEKIVAHELKHPVDLEFNPGGVRCVLRIPVRKRGDFEMRQQL